MMTREAFADLIDPYLFEVYTNTMDDSQDVIKDLFRVVNTDLAAETVSGIGNLGLMQPWAGQVYYDTPEALWNKTYTMEKYSLGLVLERELWEDSQYVEATNRADGLALSVYRSRQIHATSVFNNAWTAGAYVGPDSVALCGAHPYSPTNANTQSNTGTSALSWTSIEATRILMRNFKDDRGNPMMVIPDTLIVPPGLEAQALEIINSAGRSDTANRADNVRKGGYKVYTMPLLTDSNNWYMVDSKLMRQYLMWFERRKPVPERTEDFDTEVLKWKVACRYAYGFHNWRWIYGHAVA